MQIEKWRAVQKIINDYWGTIVFLLDAIMEDQLITQEILQIVWEKIHKLKDEIDKQEIYRNLNIKSIGLNLYEKNDKEFIIWFNEAEVLIKTMIDFEKEEIDLQMTIDNWNGYFWVIQIRVGKSIVADINFTIALNINQSSL